MKGKRPTEHPPHGEMEVLQRLGLIGKVIRKQDGEEMFHLTMNGRKAAKELVKRYREEGGGSSMPFIANTDTLTTDKERSAFGTETHEKDCDQMWDNGKLVEDFTTIEDAGGKFLGDMNDTFEQDGSVSEVTDMDSGDDQENDCEDSDEKDRVHRLLTEMINDSVLAKDDDSDRTWKYPDDFDRAKEITERNVDRVSRLLTLIQEEKEAKEKRNNPAGFMNDMDH